ncbi:MAG: phosphatase PAP2 family protein [Oscillospiraceae bacterium]|nr:phosphatase PAP2 family protein [Oscillospiraceae bacterium]
MPDVIQQMDEQALVWIAQNVRCALLDPFMKLYTQLGNTGMLFIVLGIVLLFFKQTRKAGFSALCAMLIGLIAVNFTIKPLVSRPRPWLVIENFQNLVPERDPNSFPSGHTNAGFAFAIAVYMSAPKKWMKIAAVCAAAVMGLSRLYVGVHFPSDVLAGTVIGSLCGLAGAWVVKTVWERLSTRFPTAPK